MKNAVYAAIAMSSVLQMAALASAFLTPTHNQLPTRLHGGRDWTNDDFLNSLGGEEGQENYDGYEGEGGYQEQQQQQPPPQPEMTDEEITEWAMRAAQFYNTDKPLGEVYGVRREGPPRKQDFE